MFDNVGEKIKTVAQVFCWLGIIASAICGLIMMFTPYMFLVGLLILVLGSLISWLSALSLYALGEIVDELKQSNRNTYEIYHLFKKDVPAKTTDSTWVCSNCGEKNDSLVQFCKNCGKHK